MDARPHVATRGLPRGVPRLADDARAKLPAMKRGAAVVSGDVGTEEDVGVLTRALDDAEPLPSTGSGPAVREHAAWALDAIDARR